MPQELPSPQPGSDFADGDEAGIEAIGEHVVKYVGPVTNVFHELMSDLVRVDILVVGPRPGREFTTLVTCGMSERPMRVPIEKPEDLGVVPELRYAELMLALPSDWPLTDEAFQREENYWPVRWLKKLARLPHQHESYLGLGHTVPNGDPPRPFASNTQFCCWFVDEPVLCLDEFQKLRFGGKVVNFYGLVALYADEVALKLREGSGALIPRLDRGLISELIGLNRASVCGRL